MLGGINVIYEWGSLPRCLQGKPVAARLSDPASIVQSHLTAGESSQNVFSFFSFFFFTSDIFKPFLIRAACNS